jgi:hypothetical protein
MGNRSVSKIKDKLLVFKNYNKCGIQAAVKATATALSSYSFCSCGLQLDTQDSIMSLCAEASVLSLSLLLV